MTKLIGLTKEQFVLVDFDDCPHCGADIVGPLFAEQKPEPQGLEA